MKFKEAYEKYKKNEANEEERNFVEEQIEQFQTLMDICIEDEQNDEDKIIAECRYEELDNDLYKKVKKAMQWKRIKYVVILLLVICLINVSFTLWKGFTVYEFNEKEGSQTVYSNMHVLGSELSNPENYQRQISVQRAGFGKFNLYYEKIPTIQLANYYEGKGIGQYNYKDTFYKRTWSGVGAIYERNDSEHFEHPYGINFMNASTTCQKSLDEQMIASASKNTLFSMYLKLDQEMPLEDILEMNAKYKEQGIDLGLRWMPIYYGLEENETGTGASFRYIGFDFFHEYTTIEIQNYDKERYPLLQIEYDENKEELPIEAYDADMYKTHILSVLNYVLDHEEYNSAFQTNMDEARKAKQLVETAGIKSDILYVNIYRDDLLELIQDDRIVSGCIADTVQVF